MSELQLRLADPAWDEGRARAALGGVVRRRRSRRLMRGATVLLLVFAALAGWRLWPRPQLVEFADGSHAELLDEGSQVSEGPRGPNLLVAHLDAGRARFDVVHDASRRFRVESGGVAVEVLGTRFTVEKSGERTRVAVERGRVRVVWRDGYTELAVGQSGLYPPDDDVARLLQAADAARSQGRPADALAPLEQIVGEHARDPRAPLAAFTLGRLYLDELHRPEEAAAAFARARALDPDGPLAADARTREAQARGQR